MKRILISLAVLSLLSACGSDDKGGAPAAAGSPAPTKQTPPGPVADKKCPEFDGVYTRKVKVPQEDGSTEETDFPVELRTKIEDGAYKYMLGAGTEFKAADEELKEITEEGVEGKTRLSCDQSSVTFYTIPADSSTESSTIKYSFTRDKKLKIETNGPLFSMMEGEYTKQ